MPLTAIACQDTDSWRDGEVYCLVISITRRWGCAPRLQAPNSHERRRHFARPSIPRRAVVDTDQSHRIEAAHDFSRTAGLSLELPAAPRASTMYGSHELGLGRRDIAGAMMPTCFWGVARVSSRLNAPPTRMLKAALRLLYMMPSYIVALFIHAFVGLKHY